MLSFRSNPPRCGRVARWVFLALLLLAPGASALNPARAITQYVHDSWQIDEGLPQNSVRAIVQGPDGYLWLAGQEGLIRFDGLTFTVYDSTKVPELRSNNLLALLLARDGSLWIGSESGLIRLKDRRFSSPKGLALEKPVLALAEGVDGVLWVGTDGGGLKRLEGEAVQSFTMAEGLPNNSVSALLADADGALWVGTRGGGLCRFTDGRCTVYGVQDGLPSDHILALHKDGNGTLWVGTRKGLSRRDGKRFVADGPTENVLALRTDRDGNLWVGTYGAGVARKTSRGVSFYSTAEGLTDNLVRAMYEDREGSLWIGTEGGGLNRLRNGRLLTYSMTEGLKSNSIWPILQDRSGAVWIGTAGGGLFRFEKDRFTQYTADDGLADMVVSSLFEDHEGTLWVGTKAGLHRLRGGKFTPITPREGLGPELVWAITEDPDGSLWIGTAAGGLLHWRDGKSSALTIHDGLPHNSVFALHRDRAGRLWIGTSGGLSRLDGHQLITFTEGQGVAKKPISSFYEDSEGTLWIGTQGAGLIRFKDDKFFPLTTAHGLYNDVSYRVLEDGAGNLWISCNKGLFRVSKRQLNDVADGHAQRAESVSYGREDGMLAAECNGAFQPSGWATRDGRLWFPTVKGVVVVDPAQLPTNEVIPPVVIDRVVVDDADVDPTAPVVLKPGTKTLAVHYAGLSLVAPKKVMFRSQLEGFQEGWSRIEPLRAAYYNTLAPGQYRFHVIASNNDGLWNKEGASLTLTQLPYFYQTRWFLMLSVLAGGLALAAGYRLRLNQVERSHRRDLDRLELQKEMELTAAVQAFFLPRLGFFGDGRVQLKGFYRPAAKCGGDWWWYDAGHGKKISVMVGDVTGHGVASAMITAVVAGGLYALQHGGPERELRSTLHELNQELLDLCSGEYHMTLSAAQLDPATGELEWWNAGGPPLLLIRREGTILPIASVGSPLGSNDFLVTPVRLSLRRGDRVLLFTDGLPELELPGGKQLGMRRLCRILEQTYRLPLEEATQAIVNELDLARMSQPQTDDLAFALLEMTEEPLVTAMPLSEHATSNTHN